MLTSMGFSGPIWQVIDALGGESEIHEKPAQPPGRKGNEHDALRDWQTKQALYNDTRRCVRAIITSRTPDSHSNVLEPQLGLS